MATKTMSQTAVIKMTRTKMMINRLYDDAKMDDTDVDALEIMKTVTADNDVDRDTENLDGR